MNIQKYVWPFLTVVSMACGSGVSTVDDEGNHGKSPRASSSYDEDVDLPSVDDDGTECTCRSIIIERVVDSRGFPSAKSTLSETSLPRCKICTVEDKGTGGNAGEAGSAGSAGEVSPPVSEAGSGGEGTSDDPSPIAGSAGSAGEVSEDIPPAEDGGSAGAGGEGTSDDPAPAGGYLEQPSGGSAGVGTSEDPGPSGGSQDPPPNEEGGSVEPPGIGGSPSEGGGTSEDPPPNGGATSEDPPPAGAPSVGQGGGSSEDPPPNGQGGAGVGGTPSEAGCPCIPEGGGTSEDPPPNGGATSEDPPPAGAPSVGQGGGSSEDPPPAGAPSAGGAPPEMGGASSEGGAGGSCSDDPKPNQYKFYVTSPTSCYGSHGTPTMYCVNTKTQETVTAACQSQIYCYFDIPDTRDPWRCYLDPAADVPRIPAMNVDGECAMVMGTVIYITTGDHRRLGIDESWTLEAEGDVCFAELRPRAGIESDACSLRIN